MNVILEPGLEHLDLVLPAEQVLRGAGVESGPGLLELADVGQHWGWPGHGRDRLLLLRGEEDSLGGSHRLAGRLARQSRWRGWRPDRRTEQVLQLGGRDATRASGREQIGCRLFFGWNSGRLAR